MKFPDSIVIVDSHTEGEPTRVVVEGWPAPAGSDMAARRDDMRSSWDHLRTAVIHEPRGHDAIVGALLTEPVTPGALAGVIFFNNVGYLGMCGHGLIGVVRTLQHLGRLAPGDVTLDTTVGVVAAELHDDGRVTIRNVVSHCHARDVAVDVPGVGRVIGDIAWGGNWFFIAHVAGVPIELTNLDELMRVTRAIQEAIDAAGITGADGERIDHIELTGSALPAVADARNFVLCPGAEYDRSPCGTGTSAKMAVLHARGQLKPGSTWRQESVTGGLFEGWIEEHPDGVTPYIRARAHVTAETVLRFDPADPFRAGFSSK
ncbi:MAG: proline racemase family protein [Gemmatimonadota bacterium]